MIAFVAQPYHRGGVTRWMVDAAVEWARRGERVWFVCPTPNRVFLSAGSQPPLLRVLEVADPEGRVRRVSTDVGPAYELGTERYRASVVFELLRRHVPSDATVILSDEPAIWQAGQMAAERQNVIGVLHADDEHYYQLAARHGSSLAALVCVSARVAATASTRLGWPRERLHRIPCGIPLQLGEVSRPRELSHRLIWVGRIEQRQKRVLDLPRILVATRALGCELTLDIVGDGPDADALRQAVRAAGVESYVTWHGWRDANEVRALLAGADVLTLPSNFEGMPVAVMEALGCGCGVVASSVSGLEDYDTLPLGRDCMRTHQVGDVDAAAKAIADLLRVPAAQRAAAARRFAATEFSIERCIDQYAELCAALPARTSVGRLVAPSRLPALTSLPISSLRRLRVWWSSIKPKTSAEGMV